VPWQCLAVAKGATLKVIPVDDTGQLILSAYRDLFTDETKLVAVTHVCNALGTITPVRRKSACYSTRRASRSAQATTARSRSGAASASKRPSAPR
jgi:cysteine sulfinate desulfinase/cysteine desulfurase-like protein